MPTLCKQLCSSGRCVWASCLYREQQEFDHGHVANEPGLSLVRYHLSGYLSFLLALLVLLLINLKGMFCVLSTVNEIGELQRSSVSQIRNR